MTIRVDSLLIGPGNLPIGWTDIPGTDLQMRIESQWQVGMMEIRRNPEVADELVKEKARTARLEMAIARLLAQCEREEANPPTMRPYLNTVEIRHLLDSTKINLERESLHEGVQPDDGPDSPPAL